MNERGEMGGVRRGTRFVAWIVGLSSLAAANAASVPDRQTVLVVVGASGTTEYGDAFARWARRWEEAAEQAAARYLQVGGQAAPTSPSASGSSDRDRLRDLLAAEAQEGSEPLWLVLIGHGTFDGRKAKFNLEGTDVAASELAEWLRETARPLVVINCASASGPFLTALSGPQRVLVTATKSGNEQNFARFGDYFSAAIGSPAGDLDRDGETSVLEAFLTAAHEVEHFYVQESRLATEHPLLDDNGDGRGTPADWFQGVRAVKRPQQGEVDGRRAKQWALVRSAEERTLNAETRARRDALEGELERLRDKKGELPEGEYWQQLEKILVEIAVLYREVAAVSEGER